MRRVQKTAEIEERWRAVQRGGAESWELLMLLALWSQDGSLLRRCFSAELSSIESLEDRANSVAQAGDLGAGEDSVEVPRAYQTACLSEPSDPGGSEDSVEVLVLRRRRLERALQEGDFELEVEHELMLWYQAYFREGRDGFADACPQVASYLDGGAGLLEAIMERLYPFIERQCLLQGRKLLGQGWEDLVSVVCEQLITRIDSYREADVRSGKPFAARAWLKTVVRNKSIDAWRKRSRRARREVSAVRSVGGEGSGEVIDLIERAQAGPLDSPDVRNLARALERRWGEFYEEAIAELSPTQAKIWRLHVEQGLDFDEIAQRGFNKNTARGHHQKGRRRVRAAFEGWFEENQLPMDLLEQIFPTRRKRGEDDGGA